MRKVRSWLSIESSDPPLPPLGQLPEPSFEFQVKSCCPGIDEAEKRGRKAYCQAKVTSGQSGHVQPSQLRKRSMHEIFSWSTYLMTFITFWANWCISWRWARWLRDDSRLKMLKLQLWKWAAHIFDCSCGPTLKYNFPMPSYPDLSSMGIISF